MQTTEAPSSIEHSEEVLSTTGLAVAVTIRVAELALIGAAALLIVPPLAILAVVVVVPVVVVAAAIALVVTVVAVPVLVVRHAHRHRAAHAHHVVRRLAELGRSEEASARSGVRRVVARAQRKLYVHAP